MNDLIANALAKFEFKKVSDLSKDEFGEVLSCVFECFVKSPEFERMATASMLSAMAKNLKRK